MQAMLLPVIPKSVRKRGIAMNHQHVLRILELRGVREIVAAGDQTGFAAAGVYHHHFIVCRIVRAIQKNRQAGSGEIFDQTGANLVDLSGVGQYLDVDAAPFCRDQRIGNAAMGEAEGLHEDLPARITNGLDDEFIGRIAGRERVFDQTGRVDRAIHAWRRLQSPDGKRREQPTQQD